ncbi:MAG: hypothetical protein NVV72_15785 [Asticcacaulis sp.]|nr:hypothetical protein [Asticcacaulis sp.]
MGLFGGNKEKWQKGLSILGATLKDVGAGLGHEQGGNLNQYQAQQRALAQKAAQDAVYEKLAGVLTPQAPTVAGAPADTQGLSPFAAAIQGQARGAPQAPTQPQAHGISWDQLLPVITEAQRAGIDTEDIVKAYQMAHPTKEYQGVNLGDGNFGSFDPSTGQIADLRTDPYAAKRAELLQAQIDAQRAYVPLRDAQGDYYQARAKQPYAPQRPVSRRVRGGSSEAPPSGFVLD